MQCPQRDPIQHLPQPTVAASSLQRPCGPNLMASLHVLITKYIIIMAREVLVNLICPYHSPTYHAYIVLELHIP